MLYITTSGRFMQTVGHTIQIELHFDYWHYLIFTNEISKTLGIKKKELERAVNAFGGNIVHTESELKRLKNHYEIHFKQGEDGTETESEKFLKEYLRPLVKQYNEIHKEE
jgi:hypothetical protein